MNAERPSALRVAARLAAPVGLLLCAGALAAWSVIEPPDWRSSWPVVVPAALGAALFVVGVAFSARWLARAFFHRRAAAGANVAFSILLACALLVMVNVISARHNVSWYWTEQEVFTLSSRTLNVLGELDRAGRPLKVLALLGAGEFNDRVRALLDEYARHSRLLQLRQINFYLEPAEVELVKNSLKSPPVDESIVLQYGEREKILPARDLIRTAPVRFFSRGPVEKPRFRGEPALTRGIKELLETRKAKIYFSQGHGEYKTDDFRADGAGLSELVKLLKRDYYDTGVVNLRDAGKVPDDCAVLVIVAPSFEFSQAEVEAVSQYLKRRSGKLLLMPLPLAGRGRLNALRAMLAKDFNVNVRDELVVLEPPRSWQNRSPLNIEVANWSAHPVTRDLKNLTIRLRWACPLDDLTPKAGRAVEAPRHRVTRLAWTSPRAWGETTRKLRSLRDLRRDPEDPPGPFTLALAVESIPRTPGPKQKTRIVIIGSAVSATNSIMAAKRLAKQYVNRSFLLSAVNWLAERDYDVGIEPLRLKERPLEIRPRAKRAICLISWLGIPLTLALMAAAVLWKRTR